MVKKVKKPRNTTTAEELKKKPKNKLMTPEEMKAAQKKKRAQEKKALERGVTTRELTAEDEKERQQRGRFLGKWHYGSQEQLIVYALVEGWDGDVDALARRFDVSRKRVLGVIRAIRGMGFAREEVVRYGPPLGLIDSFRYQRRTANAPRPENHMPF